MLAAERCLGGKPCRCRLNRGVNRAVVSFRGEVFRILPRRNDVGFESIEVDARIENGLTAAAQMAYRRIEQRYSTAVRAAGQDNATAIFIFAGNKELSERLDLGVIVKFKRHELPV